MDRFAYGFSSRRTPLLLFCLITSLILSVLQTMSAYLTDKVLPALKGLHGEPLLAEFVRRGENHAIMNKWHQKFFMYLVSVLPRC
jgi:hypothetical protein